MCTMADPAERFYNDLPAREQQTYVDMLVPNAVSTQVTPVTHVAWRHHPVTYLFCEGDQAIPAGVQRDMVGKARGAGAVVREVVCAAGHSPFLSMPGRVVEVLGRS